MSAIDWDLVRSSLGPLFEGLLRGTLPLTAVSFTLGLALALVVALMRLSGRRLVSAVARAYVSVIRGTPLLLQLFIIFFGLPSLGITLMTRASCGNARRSACSRCRRIATSSDGSCCSNSSFRRRVLPLMTIQPPGP